MSARGSTEDRVRGVSFPQFAMRDWRTRVVVGVIVLLLVLLLVTVLIGWRVFDSNWLGWLDRSSTAGPGGGPEEQPGWMRGFATYLDVPVTIGTFVIALVLAAGSVWSRWLESLPKTLCCRYVRDGVTVFVIEDAPLTSPGDIRPWAQSLLALSDLAPADAGVAEHIMPLGSFNVEPNPKRCSESSIRYRRYFVTYHLRKDITSVGVRRNITPPATPQTLQAVYPCGIAARFYEATGDWPTYEPRIPTPTPVKGGRDAAITWTPAHPDKAPPTRATVGISPGAPGNQPLDTVWQRLLEGKFKVVGCDNEPPAHHPDSKETP